MNHDRPNGPISESALLTARLYIPRARRVRPTSAFGAPLESRTDLQINAHLGASRIWQDDEASSLLERFQHTVEAMEECDDSRLTDSLQQLATLEKAHAYERNHLTTCLADDQTLPAAGATKCR